MFVTDEQLWRAYQDAHDSAQVSYVELDPASIPDSAVHITDAELKSYFDSHKKSLGDRPGRAVLSVVAIPRVISAADTAAARAKADSLRAEIVHGAKFDDVAKRESADSASAVKGGSLGTVGKGAFVKPFEDAAYALKPGEMSQPVLTPFGFHIIKVDAHKGDSITVRHILVRIAQSDSSAALTDRRADSLAKAANIDKPAEFDSVAHSLGLKIGHVVAIESDPLTWDGRYVAGASAWAFGGAKVGETSDLIDADDAYYLARLDSLQEGGKASFEASRDDIRRELLRTKKLDLLMPKAQAIVAAVHGGKTLECRGAGGGAQGGEDSDLRAYHPGARPGAGHGGNRRRIRRTRGLRRASREGPKRRDRAPGGQAHPGGSRRVREGEEGAARPDDSARATAARAAVPRRSARCSEDRGQSPHRSRRARGRRRADGVGTRNSRWKQERGGADTLAPPRSHPKIVPLLNQATRLRAVIRDGRVFDRARRVGAERVGARGRRHFMRDVVDVLLELLDPLAERRRHLGNSLRAEEKEDDHHDHEYFAEAQLTEHTYPLEKRTRDEIGHEHSQKAEQRYVQRHRPDRKFYDDQIDRHGTNLRGDARCKKLLYRARGKEASGNLRHQPAHNETYDQYEYMKPWAVLGRSTWGHYWLRSRA